MACADDNPPVSVPAHDYLNPAGFTSYWLSGKIKTSLAEIIKGGAGGQEIKFTKIRNDIAAFGLTGQTVYLRISLPGYLSRRDNLLEIAFPTLETINFFQVRGSRVIQSFYSGAAVEPAMRPWNHHNFIFPVLPDDAGAEIYLEVRSATVICLPLILWDKKSFNHYDNRRNFLFGMLFGLLCLMMCYNLLLFFSARDRAFLYYTAYVLPFAVFMCYLYGYAHFLAPEIAAATTGLFIPLFGILTTTGAALFAGQYLLLKVNYPFGRTLLLGVQLASIIASLMLPFIGNETRNILANVVPFGGACLVLWCVLVCLKRGFRPARYFLLAWGVLLFSVFYFILTNNAVIPANFFSVYSMIFGVTLEAVLLSLALGFRIASFKSAEEKSQRDKLEREIQLSASFARFVPRQFLNFLGQKSILDIHQGNSIRQKLTILFSDIRGFTSATEESAAEVTFRFLNYYLARMEPIIQRHGGFIDKFIGDAIMALFPGNPRQALEAAGRMQNEVRLIRKDLAIPEFSRFSANFNIGIGLSYGEIILGTVGSPARLETTVIGDAVNLAARIESVTKNYNAKVLFSDSLAHQLQFSETAGGEESLHFREIDSVLVEGKKNPVVLFELLIREEECYQAKISGLSDYLTALALFKSEDFSAAETVFLRYQAMAERMGFNDPLAQLYLLRIREIREKGLVAGWRAIYPVWKNFKFSQ